jgi:amidase
LGVAGEVTRCGSAAFADTPVETTHSAVVDLLLAKGVQIIGHVTMHELAFGVTGVNAFAGTALNPNWPDRIPGGSSSGSASAVAAGLCDFSIGTDTGGSIRQPACCCGVYGLKPTFGAIDRRGAVPRSSSLDVIGPFAATAVMLEQAAGMLLKDFEATAIKSPRLAQIAVEADADVTDALADALKGQNVAQIKLPSFVDAYEAGLVVINHELASEFGQLARSDATLGDDVRARILAALNVTDAQRAEAEAIRARFTTEVDAALVNVDALVLPTMPCVPPTLAEATDPRASIPLTRLVRPFNLSGHPALTVPIKTAAGLPAGVQLVGRKGAEATLCAIAKTLSKAISETTAPIAMETQA